MLCTLIGAIILSINIQVGLNMHLYDDIGDASSSLRGSTSSCLPYAFCLLFSCAIIFRGWKHLFNLGFCSFASLNSYYKSILNRNVWLVYRGSHCCDHFFLCRMNWLREWERKKRKKKSPKVSDEVVEEEEEEAVEELDLVRQQKALEDERQRILSDQHMIEEVSAG